MGRQGTIITGDVSQADVQWALGIGSSVDKWSQLCTHSAINVWAKYKPVSYNSWSRLTDAQRRSVNYGIKNIPVWSGSGAVNKMGNFWFRMNTSDTNAPGCGNFAISEYWGHLRPTGGSASPYRITDFIGYKKDAQAPVGGCSQGTIRISASGSMTIPFSGQGSGQTDGYTVPLSELSDNITFGDMYMSVMIHKQLGSTYYVSSRASRWGSDNSTNVTFDVPSSNVGYALRGTCEVFPFLSSKRFEGLVSDLAQETGPVVAMYQRSEVVVEIETAKATIGGFVAYYESAQGHVLSCQFSLTNSSCEAGFTASYTIQFKTSTETAVVTRTGSVYVAYGATQAISESVTIQGTATLYRDGYATVTVRAEGSGILFWEETGDATRITQGLPV